MSGLFLRALFGRGAERKRTKNKRCGSIKPRAVSPRVNVVTWLISTDWFWQFLYLLCKKQQEYRRPDRIEQCTLSVSPTLTVLLFSCLRHTPAPFPSTLFLALLALLYFTLFSPSSPFLLLCFADCRLPRRSTLNPK